MGVSLVFKDMTIKSHKGRYTVKFCPNLHELIEKVETKKSHIIVDWKVYKIYQNLLNKLYNKNEFLIIKSNEKNKSLEKMSSYVDFLVKNKIRRSDQLIAIGGGIIQDITCFLSATLLRGVDWYFIPTTLLAQADSCIGSKSSINCNGVKNILGTFTPPKKIFVCPEFLSTSLKYKKTLKNFLKSLS